MSPGIGFGPAGDGHVRFALVENEHRIGQAVRGSRALDAPRRRRGGLTGAAPHGGGVTMEAIQIDQLGGPEVLKAAQLPDPIPNRGEWWSGGAAGLNYVDTYHRTGLYPHPLLSVPGQEGTGSRWPAPTSPIWLSATASCLDRLLRLLRRVGVDLRGAGGDGARRCRHGDGAAAMLRG